MANTSMGRHLHHLMRRVDLPMSLTICVASILPLRISEDNMDDNGMSRYMENNDEEGWD